MLNLGGGTNAASFLISSRGTYRPRGIYYLSKGMGYGVSGTGFPKTRTVSTGSKTEIGGRVRKCCRPWPCTLPLPAGRYSGVTSRLQLPSQRCPRRESQREWHRLPDQGFLPRFGPLLLSRYSGKVPHHIDQRLSSRYDNLGISLKGFCNGLKLLK